MMPTFLDYGVLNGHALLMLEQLLGHVFMPLFSHHAQVSSKNDQLNVFVADGINSVGDYNSPPGGCRLYVSVCLYVCVSPLFFTFHDWITSKRFELSG